MSKFPLGHLQFYIAEIVFGVRCTLRFSYHKLRFRNNFCQEMYFRIYAFNSVL